MEKKSVKLPITAVETINKILEKGSDVLIKLRENKSEIDIFEQRNSVFKKIPAERE